MAIRVNNNEVVGNRNIGLGAKFAQVSKVQKHHKIVKSQRFKAT